MKDVQVWFLPGARAGWARGLLLSALALSVAGCYDPSRPDQVQPFVITLLVFIFGLIAVIFAVTLLSVRHFIGRFNINSTPIDNGIPADAIIESIADTGFTGSAPGIGAYAPRYRLWLNVTPAGGAAGPYPVEVTVFIPRIYAPMIVPGAHIGVVVDPANPANVRLDFNRITRPAAQA